MRLKRTERTVSQVMYDADARALYARVGSSSDRIVMQTLAAGGVNFDVNLAGQVIGIEVLLNDALHLHKRSVPLPRVSDDRYDLYMAEEPDVSDVQIYDPDNRRLFIGDVDHRTLCRLSDSVSVSLDTEVRLVIDGLDL